LPCDDDGKIVDTVTKFVAEKKPMHFNFLPLEPQLMEIAYWTIRGLGAPLRMICEHVGALYKPVLYDCTKIDGEWNKDVWFKDAKPSVRAKNKMANLPYIVDGPYVICQTNACFTYLGKKFKLYGKDDHEMEKVDQCLCQVMDLRNDMVSVFYGSSDNFEADKDDLIKKKAPKHLQKMENWLVHHKTVYCASDELSVVDFHLWELLDQLELFVKHFKEKSLLEGRPQLQQLYANIKGLSSLKNYFEGDLYKKMPVNQLFANWQ